jgi:predicted Zn-dependent protease
MDNETVCANLLMTYSVLNDEKIVHILKERLTAQNPQNPILKGRLAIEELRAGNYETANSLIREICEKTNCQYILDYYLALIQVKLENNAKAIEYFEASLEKNPLFTLCSIEYSKFLIDIGKYVEAKRKLRKALKYDENNPKLLNLLFHVSYILVKEDVCEYNVKEAINIAKNIKDPDLFEYKDELKDLTEMLENLKENVIE